MKNLKTMSAKELKQVIDDIYRPHEELLKEKQKKEQRYERVTQRHAQNRRHPETD